MTSNDPIRHLTSPSSRQGPAGRAALCVAIATTALLTPLTPALADEAREVAVEINYTWTSRDLTTVPMSEDSDAIATELLLVLTPNPDAGFPNLGAHCIALGKANQTSGEYAQSGDCVFRDIDGDALYEEFTGAGAGGGAPVRGTATITGGTGKFTGVSGELEWEAHYYASPIEGTYQGSGVKKGTLRRPAS